MILKIIKEFVSFALMAGLPIGAVLVVQHPGQAGNALAQGIAVGIGASVIISLNVLVRFIFFRLKWFRFSNMKNAQEQFNLGRIRRESLVIDASKAPVVGGGLFLGTNRLLFIPRRGTSGREPLDIPLADVDSVEIEGIDMAKFFSGGLRKRLAIRTKDDRLYQFGVWDTEGWHAMVNAVLLEKGR